MKQSVYGIPRQGSANIGSAAEKPLIASEKRKSSFKLMMLTKSPALIAGKRSIVAAP
jgi:hypothetical protein